MCYLCLKDNPFAITDINFLTNSNRKARAVEIKALLKEMEGREVCDAGREEIERLKEEQYILSQVL